MAEAGFPWFITMGEFNSPRDWERCADFLWRSDMEGLGSRHLGRRLTLRCGYWRSRLLRHSWMTSIRDSKLIALLSKEETGSGI